MNNKILAFTIILIAVGVTSVMLFQLINPLTVQEINPQENLIIADSEIWIETGFVSAQASVLLHNKENVGATIRQVTIRGVTCEWSNVYYWKGELGSIANLGSAQNTLTGTSFKAVIDGSERTFQQATGEIELAAYTTLVLYVKNAGSITPESVLSGNATLAVYTKVNVYLYQASITAAEATIGFMATEEITITNVEFTEPGVQITAKNTGSTSVTLNEAYVGNTLIWGPYPGQEVPAGESYTITAAEGDYNPDTSYQFKVVSAKGNPFVYTATAPS